jgi:peptide/nickel transport system substrate-binding protein
MTTGDASGFTAQRTNRRTFLEGALGAALVGLPVLSGCGGDNGDPAGAGRAPARGRTGGSAVGGIGYNTQKLDPAKAADTILVSAGWHMFEALVDYDVIGRKLTPGLATEVPDGTRDRVTLRLRDGARFHNGRPVTAADVVASVKRVKDPKTTSPFARFLEFVEDVRARDSKTVEFRLAYGKILLPWRLPLVKIVPEAVVERDPKRFEVKPVGSGPYAFEELKPNDHVTLRRFEEYAGDKQALLDELEFRAMVEPSSRIAGLLTKDIHVAEDVRYGDLERLERTPGIQVASVPGYHQTVVFFHCGKPPFDDKRVRQAFHYGIDREAIARDVLKGKCELATSSMLPKEHEAYAQPSRQYTYDPERARHLLRQAGHPDGIDVELQVNKVAWIEPQGPYVKQQLEKAGIRVRLVTGLSAKLFDNVLAGKYQAFLNSTDPSVFGHDADTLLRWLHEGLVPDQFTRWKTPGTKRVATLLDEAAELTDEAKRHERYAAVQEILAEEAPSMSLHVRHQPTAWTSELASFHPSGTNGLNFLGASRA